MSKILKKVEALVWFVVFFLVGLVEAFLSPFIRIVAVFSAFLGRGKFKQWGINVWEGVDNMVSSEVGGDPDESISSRLGKARKRGSSGWGFIANKLDLVAEELMNDKDHCAKSIEHDEGRKQVTHY